MLRAILPGTRFFCPSVFAYTALPLGRQASVEEEEDLPLLNRAGCG